jgi:hypothetical protein
MDLWGVIAWLFVLGVMGMSSTALSQIASLKQEVRTLRQEIKALTDELCRRGLLEQPVGERKLIVPESYRPK